MDDRDAKGEPANESKAGSARGVRQSSVRAANRTLLLRELRADRELSRAELARRSGLTRATVSSVVRDLEADGLVAETGRTTGSGGKPAHLIAFEPDAQHVVALDASRSGEVVGGLVNLDGVVVSRRTVPLGGRAGGESVDAVVRLAADLVRSADRPLLGLGAAVPGIVSGDGTVVEASHLAWTDIELARLLTEATGLPAIVTNDATAVAQGELASDPAGSTTNLLAVRVDRGVGAGLALNGQLVPGETFSAGEIGHCIVDPFGDECVCGRRGCLETLVSMPLGALDADAVSPEERRSVIIEAGHALGSALALVLSATNVERLVISGASAATSPDFLRAVRSAVGERSMPSIHSGLEIRSSRAGVDDVLVGAGSLVLAAQTGLV